MQLVYDKQLIPVKFGLGNAPVTGAGLEHKIQQGLKNIKLTPAVQQYCLELFNNSKQGRPTFIQNALGIPTKDLNIIFKDFGEITGAMFMLKSQSSKYASVKFPTGNEKLIDYILVTKDGVDERFSAKAGQGGKPSVTSVMPVIKKFSDEGKLKGKHKLAAEVLDLISTDQKNGLYLGPLLAARKLKTPGYLALIAVLKKLKVHSGLESEIPTPEQMLEAVNKAGNYTNIIRTFDDFFAKAGYKLNLNPVVTQRLIETPREGKEKKWGVLHYPITAELIKWLNTPANGAQDILTMAANTLTVTQVYLDYSAGNTLKYTVKGFSDAQFIFGSPSSMPRPTNNRIGFTMKKSPTPK